PAATTLLLPHVLFPRALREGLIDSGSSRILGPGSNTCQINVLGDPSAVADGSTNPGACYPRGLWDAASGAASGLPPQPGRSFAPRRGGIPPRPAKGGGGARAPP